MTKRKQVKNACGIIFWLEGLYQLYYFLVNCQKACKKCDDQRPCERCKKYGLDDTCRDSARKERKKGVRRGPYSRHADDGETDESDALSSTRWSDETRNDFDQTPPAIRLSYERKSPAMDDRRWGQHPSDRPVRSSRQKNLRYTEDAFYEERTQSRSVPLPSHIGAPDGSYIKALGVVCTEVLRKIEEEDLPPAVTFSEWPPRVDQHFVPVSFSEHQLIYRTGLDSSVQIRQPMPVQRAVHSAVFESNGMDVSLPTSSSPIESSESLSRSSYDIMTPPETPVDFASSGLLKVPESTVTLPPFSSILHSN